ncbi:TPA_asm: hypothetical protein GND48_004216 [Salmonella enterica subsp. houtenae serovar 41:z4,z23:-]|nr:hypothetical protein [Salmonella enterica]HAE4738986.1 hypothetical protein [Salmonella enterica subsp. houtenae serovar 41:z4,z23:-]
MTNNFTIDDVIDLPPDTKRIFKETFNNIRFTHNAEHIILALLKRIYKGEASEIQLTNIISRCLAINKGGNATIINSATIDGIINDELSKLNHSAND